MDFLTAVASGKNSASTPSSGADSLDGGGVTEVASEFDL